MRNLNAPPPATPAEYVAQTLAGLDLYEFWAVEAILMGHRRDGDFTAMLAELTDYFAHRLPPQILHSVAGFAPMKGQPVKPVWERPAGRTCKESLKVQPCSACRWALAAVVLLWIDRIAFYVWHLL